MLNRTKTTYWRFREWVQEDLRAWLVRRLPAGSRSRWRAAQQAELGWWRRFLQSDQWRAQAVPKPLPGETWLDHRRSVMGRWEAEAGLPLSTLITADSLVLDLGCGPYSLVRRGRVVALDPLCGRYAELIDMRADADIRYIAGAGERLPFADGAFDVVWSRNVIDHVRDPVAFVAEALRVVRPGGRFLLTFDLISKPSVYHPHAYIDEAWVRAHAAGRIAGTWRLPSDELMVVLEK